MRQYVGLKLVDARPMAKMSDPPQLGYEVRYEDGYTSWSPADVFEASYQPTGCMGFEGALFMLKRGHRVARAGWNGKGMWIAYSPGFDALPAERFFAPQNRRYAEENGPTDVLGCITMKTADGKILMGWLASQTDMLAEDWQVVG